MRRVLVIGSPGAGKSTLAAELARRTGLPLIHLDQQYWRPGWIEPPRDEWQQTVKRLISRGRWIIDGNYGGTLDLRLSRADAVIDLESPTWLCLWRILRRLLSWRGRVRADMADGCPERLNPAFLAYVTRFRFGPRKRIHAKLATFRGQYIRLTNPAEVRDFLSSVR